MDWSGIITGLIVTIVGGVVVGLILARMAGGGGNNVMVNSNVQTTNVVQQTRVRIIHHHPEPRSSSTSTRQGDDDTTPVIILGLLAVAILLTPYFKSLALGLLIGCVLLATIVTVAIGTLLIYRVRLSGRIASSLVTAAVGTGSGLYAAISLASHQSLRIKDLESFAEAIYLLLGWAVAAGVVLLSCWITLGVIADSALTLGGRMRWLWLFVVNHRFSATWSSFGVVLSTVIIYLFMSGTLNGWINHQHSLPSFMTPSSGTATPSVSKSS